MTLIILLFAVGLLFIGVEVIIPGGILGVVGGLLMFGGCVAAFLKFGTFGGTIAIGCAVIVTVIALILEFRVLPRTRMGKRAFLTAEISGVSSALGTGARDLIGKTAQAITVLSPSGYVLIDGQRYEAFSQSGQIPVGTGLEVTGADNFRLIVTLTKTKTN